ncbi:MAG: PPC domain-containing protein [Planctomycetaceae bacterium]
MALLLLSIENANAQTAYPMLMSVHPVAAQTGETSLHTVQSRYSMHGASRILVTGKGVTGEVVTKMAAVKPGGTIPNLTKLQVRFKVEKNAQPGVRDFRIITPRGASTIGQLVVARDPVIVEKGSNNTPATAQTIKLPATICGVVERAEDVDYFKFSAKAGQHLAFHVRSMRLQDRIHDLQRHVDPIISLKTAQGTTLAQSDNHFAADPFLTYQIPRDGDYLLEVRDVRYHGNTYWEYSIEASDRPFVSGVFPMGIAAGKPAKLRPISPQLANAPAVTIPALKPATSGPRQIQLPLSDGLSNPVTVFVSDAPQFVEQSEKTQDNDTPAKGQQVSVPCGISGVIQKSADIDCFTFSAKKGERYSFEVHARRYGSSLDSHLRILDVKTGRQLQLNDDMSRNRRTFPDSKIENWTVPADGTYCIEIRDLHLSGSEQHGYYLEVTRAEPDFELYLDTDKTQLTPGTSAVIFARVFRKNGFQGEVKLHVDGLPEGVTASCGRILAGKSTDGCIVLTAAKNAKPVAGNIIVRGTAETRSSNGESRELSTVAVPQQETYMPGGGRSHWHVDMHTVSVGSPGDIRSMTLSTYQISLKPGESRRIDVTIVRAPGFNKNVTLDLLYRHLSSTFGNTLPPGITIDTKNSKTLLTGNISKGYITLKAAPNATPVENQQISVMANISLNFVMKYTYSAPPLMISVLKP